MAEQVEGSFNQIWRVDRPRSLARRVSEYLSVILVGPVVMVTAMALIASLRSTALMQELSGMADAGLSGPPANWRPTRSSASASRSSTGSCRTRRCEARAALAGGLVGGVLWAGTGRHFRGLRRDCGDHASASTRRSPSSSRALFWLYLCWLILLVGAQVAFYVQNRDYLRVGYRQPVTGTGPAGTDRARGHAAGRPRHSATRPLGAAHRHRRRDGPAGPGAVAGRRPARGGRPAGAHGRRAPAARTGTPTASR